MPKSVRKHILAGKPKKAAEVLLTNGMAKLDVVGLATLRSLHPDPTDHSIPMPTLPPAADRRRHPSPGAIPRIIANLPPQSAPGLTGWTYEMMKEGFKRKLPSFTSLTIKLVNDMLDGKDVPMKAWLTASRLIALATPGGGIRPIACGEVLTRIASRYALSLIDVQETLDPVQFGVDPQAGVEAAVTSIEDSIPWASNGLVGIDFRNAFNTVSRRAMADAVRRRAPKLAGIFQVLYNEPSDLVCVDTQGKATTLKSATGGRQGDPLMPLLFSMVMRELLADLEPYIHAVRVTEPLLTRRERPSDLDDLLPDSQSRYTDDGEPQEPRRLVWAYLDDLVFALREGVSLQDVIAFLERPEIIARYGLLVNAAKCWIASRMEMETVGKGVLGTWVGGPDDESSAGSELTQKVAAIVRERLDVLENRSTLSLQQKLIIARLCYYPTMNHLLRTLHPAVGVDGAREFDSALFSSVLRWIGDSSLTCPGNLQKTRDIFSLPLRLGGLGFMSQAEIKPAAAGARLILCQATLRERGLSCSRRLATRYSDAIQLCASNLNLPVEDVLLDVNAQQAQLQRRVTQVVHERNWLQSFSRLDSQEDRSRRLEALGPLARSWVSLIPTDLSLALSNDDIRFGLRALLLSPFSDAHPTSPSNVCERCLDRPDGNRPCPLGHFLSCRANQVLITHRHNAIKKSLLVWFQQVYKTAVVMEEVPLGTFINANNAPQQVSGDIQVVGVGSGPNQDYDIGVTTVRNKEGRLVNWPTDQEVDAAILAQPERRSNRWDLGDGTSNNSDEAIHPDTKRLRMFRQLAWEAAVLPHIREMHDRKVAHYRRAHVSGLKPLVFTAMGSISSTTRDTLHQLVFSSCPLEEVQARAEFRRRLFGRLGVLLVKYGRMTHQDQRRFFLSHNGIRGGMDGIVAGNHGVLVH